MQTLESQLSDEAISPELAKIATHSPQFNRSCIRNQGHDHCRVCAEEVCNISQGYNRSESVRATSHTVAARDVKAWKRNGG